MSTEGGTNTEGLSPKVAVDELIALSDQAVITSKASIDALLAGSSAEPRWGRYPELVVHVEGTPETFPRASYGVVQDPGVYSSEIAQPALFRYYLTEQLELLARRYPVHISVREGSTIIPLQYMSVMDDDALRTLPPGVASALGSEAPLVDILAVNDAIADGDLDAPFRPANPLFLFSPLRTDLALQRLRHYTGSNPADFQDYVLFTNYALHVDSFIEYALELSRAGGVDTSSGAAYTWISGPDGLGFPLSELNNERAQQLKSAGSDAQMPAWHLFAADSDTPGGATISGHGISLVNIGVGPSNAKTITDCVAVLRPHCWMMVGHCAGLDARMNVGDLILPNSYLRKDGVLDRYVSPDTPVPALAEVQQALEVGIGSSYVELMGVTPQMRTGTVMTTHDRNWEYWPADEIQGLLARTAVMSVEMESGTIAANGYRYRVPYGALLAVSDKPLHNQPKLPTMARQFYQASKYHHFLAAVHACQHLANSPRAAHSRKLRRVIGEVPFR